MSSDPARTLVRVGDRELALSNLDKVLYPDDGFTKGDVISHYARLAPALLPHVIDRPLTLRRYPNGVAAQSFFEKNVPKGAPEWVRTTRLPRNAKPGDRATVDYIVVTEVATLIWVANLASLELHVPMWRVDAAGHPLPPDLLVFDLDPGPSMTVVECCRVARLLYRHLEQSSIEPYPKTSGSKGLQLYARAPASDGNGRATIELAHELAERLARDHPQLVVSNMRKDLRKRRIFIDWSQNNVAKTTVAVYSLRARPSPTVSTPVTWDEVDGCVKSGDPASLSFTAPQVRERVDDVGDLFAPLLDPA